jgi:malonate decarboxylase epsilon subunit
MTIAFLFPGQGSQYPGMLDHLPQTPVVISLFEQASRFLNRDVRELDCELELQSTVSVQMALYVGGVASAKALRAEGVEPHAVAGMSVGAYAAAVSCGCLSFLDGLAMVKMRAQLMHKYFPSGYGMTAVVGLTEQKVEALVRQCRSDDMPIFVSNINAPLQITVSGSLTGLAKVEAAAINQGARKIERLNVNVPSHCCLYQEAAQQLQAQFASVKLNRPDAIYVSNIGARSLRKAEAIVDDLVNNMAHGVRWNDSMILLRELGTEIFVEMCPGNVLTRLICEQHPDSRAVALEQSSISYVKKFVGCQL